MLLYLVWRKWRWHVLLHRHCWDELISLCRQISTPLEPSLGVTHTWGNFAETNVPGSMLALRVRGLVLVSKCYHLPQMLMRIVLAFWRELQQYKTQGKSALRAILHTERAESALPQLIKMKWNEILGGKHPRCSCGQETLTPAYQGALTHGACWTITVP